jgi:hypothetical protein
VPYQGAPDDEERILAEEQPEFGGAEWV